MVYSGDDAYALLPNSAACAAPPARSSGSELLTISLLLKDVKRGYSEVVVARLIKCGHGGIASAGENGPGAVGMGGVETAPVRTDPLGAWRSGCGDSPPLPCLIQKRVVSSCPA